MTPMILPIGKAGKLIYIATDRFKSELLSVSLSVPISAANAQQNAMVAALSRRGTVSYPTQAAINKRLDEMYSTAISTSNRRTGDMQTLRYSADFLGARYVGGGAGLLPEVVAMLRELLTAPKLTENGYTAAYVESEKRVLADAIRSRINNPRGYALMRCRQLLCEGEPYALSLVGEADTINGLTPSALADRYRALKSEAAPIFCYVGNTAAAEVVALLENGFDELGGNAAPYRAEQRSVWGVKRGEEEMPLQQGKLSIGFRTDVTANSPEAAALTVLNELFGGSPASKLFLNVRERLSLCYHCSSGLDIFKGVLTANCGMKVENRAIAEEAILAQMEDIRRGNITDVELDAARGALENAYRQSYDSAAVVSRFYADRLLANAFETVEERRRRISRVTREDVVDVAARVFEGAVFFLKGTLEGEGGIEE